MNESPAVGGGVEFRDRRTGLLVAGILLIVLGAGAWLMALLSGLGGMVMARQGVSMMSIVPGLLMYVAMGAAAVTLGVGTLRMRRWARALGQALSGGGLLFGIGSAVGMAFWMPQMTKSMMPPGAGNGPPAAILGVVMVVVGILMIILFVAFPLGFLLFYRNRQVKATCEAADPGVSWVDSCPEAILTTSVWMAVMALGLLVAPLAYGGHFPLFGNLVGGLAGWGLWCLGALVGAAAARGLFRCRWWGWGLGLALVLGIGASGVMTFLRTDMREIYQAIGMVGPQIEMIERMGMLDPSYTVGTALSGLIPFLILMASALPALSRANRVT